MKLEELIGAKLARLREARGMSQAQVGEALSAFLDKPWSRQAVSAAEKGRRAFTAAELVSLALSLRVTLVELLLPLDGASDLELPSGAKIDAEAYERAIVILGESERGQDLLDQANRLHSWVYKLAVMVATGAPPYDTISNLINEGVLTNEEVLSLVKLRQAFGQVKVTDSSRFYANRPQDIEDFETFLRGPESAHLSPEQRAEREETLREMKADLTQARREGEA